MLDRQTGAFRVVPFHVVGVVQEFPSAPKDSFMVANLGYLQTPTMPRPERRVRQGERRPAAVASRVAAATTADGTMVKDINQQTARPSARSPPST